ncbi:carboxypeptidase regulatory-like domain-containing protein [Paraburkholderia silviterrae]|uniref:Carboxypeptidase regulatory-like domain-containing protein n=1 Tax=Paraburkholderia silviterrae TaxID=2528715 RepID=A0A4R5MHN8_9BURK|nr:carboxypeptidase regulatory-like domain-containing protein [Paraburkholderia silviterrae]TDG26320.1 carboxypeptidase regulatory-like domain-containing protein [Paraburkholderia silviterrae]
MKARSTPWMGAALSLAAALALALGAPAAFAATSGSSGTTAAQAAAGVLPPAQHAGSISYLSGGIGSDQSAAFKAAMTRYPLSLEFARESASGNEYLANVPVKISDAHGQPLLSTRTNGPFMLVTLPNGHYVVTASHDGKTVQRAVDIGKTSHAHEAFVWPM